MDGPAQLPDELLRPALEFAVLVAAHFQKSRPPLPFPAGLKPYLKFQKLPAPALAGVRKAVEGDDAFRARLGSTAGEPELRHDIGALSHLWLARPEGWEEEAARIVTDELAERERVGADRQERSALKRAEAAEASAARARAELVVLRDEVTTERARRKEADAARHAGAARIAELEAELERVRLAARGATDQAAAARRTLEQANAARSELQAAHDALSVRLDDVLAERARSLAVPPAAGPDQAAVAGAAQGLRDAAASLAQLATALGDTARALGTSRPPASTSSRSSTRRERAGRTPLAIPGGLLADQAEVVRHLLRTPGVSFIIDGYNVAKTGWPDRPLEQQRERLLDLLDDLVRRVGTKIHVVFDGSDVAVPSPVRRLMVVRFSPAGVSADDIIRQAVAELPDDVPVVVVTTDAAIVSDVRAVGANTLTSAQFLAGTGR